MTEWLQLQSAWRRASEADERALLFTVVNVIGSSYRKVGAHMLATESGTICGAVSAGCIEADLIARLPELFASDLPQVLSYTNTNDDEFALNRGCNSDICILVESCPAALRSFETAQSTRTTQVRFVTVMGRTFVEKVHPPIRLYIFGTQRDSAPLRQLAETVDMELAVIAKQHVDSLEEVNTDSRTAAIIMSHDYDRDRDALSFLRPKNLPYLGIMGPKYRTEQMLSELGMDAGTLRYPVGIDIRAEGAQEIAVSVISELIATFRSTPRIATVILAAGAATRFGAPKQLAQLNGTSFVRRMALECLAIADSTKTVVVAGCYADQVTAELSDLPVQILLNPDWQSGIGTSIATAADWAQSAKVDGVLITTCDQVLLTSAHFQSLLSARTLTDASIVTASYNDTLGIPCYFGRSLFTELSDLPTSDGARFVIQNHLRSTCSVHLPEAGADIDCSTDFEQLRSFIT